MTKLIKPYFKRTLNQTTWLAILRFLAKFIVVGIVVGWIVSSLRGFCNHKAALITIMHDALQAIIYFYISPEREHAIIC